MYKAFDDEMENEERQSETPLLFIIGDKLKGEEENAFDEKKLKKPTAAWEDNKSTKRTKRVLCFRNNNNIMFLVFFFFGCVSYFSRSLRIK